LNNQKFSFELKWNKESWKVFWWIWEKDLIQAILKKFKIQLTKKNIYLPDWHLKKVWEHIAYIKITEKEMAKIFIDLKIKD
jgi:ribosomal protein L9